MFTRASTSLFIDPKHTSIVGGLVRLSGSPAVALVSLLGSALRRARPKLRWDPVNQRLGERLDLDGSVNKNTIRYRSFPRVWMGSNDIMIDRLQCENTPGLFDVDLIRPRYSKKRAFVLPLVVARLWAPDLVQSTPYVYSTWACMIIAVRRKSAWSRLRSVYYWHFYPVFHFLQTISFKLWIYTTKVFLNISSWYNYSFIWNSVSSSQHDQRS